MSSVSFLESFWTLSRVILAPENEFLPAVQPQAAITCFLIRSGIPGSMGQMTDATVWLPL